MRFTPMSPLWIACTLVLATTLVLLVIRRFARLHGACPGCGRTLRPGAVKCPACGTWFAGG